MQTGSTGSKRQRIGDESGRSAADRRFPRRGMATALAVVAIVVLAAALAGCGDTDEAAGTAPQGTNAENGQGGPPGGGGRGMMAGGLLDELVAAGTIDEGEAAAIQAAMVAQRQSGDMQPPADGDGAGRGERMLAVFRAALDGLVADGTLEEQQAEDVMDVIESRMPAGPPDGGAPPDGVLAV